MCIHLLNLCPGFTVTVWLIPKKNFRQFNSVILHLEWLLADTLGWGLERCSRFNEVLDQNHLTWRPDLVRHCVPLCNKRLVTLCGSWEITAASSCGRRVRVYSSYLTPPRDMRQFMKGCLVKSELHKANWIFIFSNTVLGQRGFSMISCFSIVVIIRKKKLPWTSKWNEGLKWLSCAGQGWKYTLLSVQILLNHKH